MLNPCVSVARKHVGVVGAILLMCQCSLSFARPGLAKPKLSLPIEWKIPVLENTLSVQLMEMNQENRLLMEGSAVGALGEKTSKSVRYED